MRFPTQYTLLLLLTALHANGQAQDSTGRVEAAPPARTSPSPTLVDEIKVFATLDTRGNQSDGARAITPREVEASAGTFGDLSRFLQTMAGVASDNDQRNDFLVRGGNPVENSFVIDNIEVPTINQLALSDTTGGFVSMLDAAAIQQITFLAEIPDSRYDERLSSVIEISTRPLTRPARRVISEVGIAGAGSSLTTPFGRTGSLFVSSRHSILQYFTDDIGLNGVPDYKNFFARAENRIDDRNSWWGMSLTGIDSIGINPSGGDPNETNPYNIRYSGWRSTTGINWQHTFSSHSFAVTSLATAAQAQSLNINGQLLADETVYQEASRDAISTLKYDFTTQPVGMLTLTAGVRSSVNDLHYQLNQPLGLQSPYIAQPAPQDATSFDRSFVTGTSAGYVQAVVALGQKARLTLGERAMHWSLGGHAGATGKASLSFPLLGRPVHLGYSENEQMPANLYLLSFDNVHNLGPIRGRQASAGAILLDRRSVKLTVDAYQKHYDHYPVAAAIPQLSLANVADTFGQAFLIFPMVDRGRGIARGIELTMQTMLPGRVSFTATSSYARNWYSGLDGVLRRGNFDLPFSTNLSALWYFKKTFSLSGRFNTYSGRPYTPDDLTLSVEQNRDVFDLTKINGNRSDGYQRLDFRIEQKVQFGRGQLTWHVGLENALNHQNFYDQLWQSRPHPGPPGTAVQYQMPLFPDGGLSYAF